MSTAVATRYLTVEDICARYGVSRRSVHEWTRTAKIPHRVLPHARRCLFDEQSLTQWENGCDLERLDLHGGGRIIRPVGSDA